MGVTRSPTELATAVWRAGVAAADPAQLVRRAICVDALRLRAGGREIDLSRVGRVLVVGGGKAGADMARGVAAVLDGHARFDGLVSVPPGCEDTSTPIRCLPGRSSADNLPEPRGVELTRAMLDRAARLGPHDLLIALVSGGASALLPAPIEGVTLDEKRRITEALHSAGAGIADVNTVRRALSRIKGGGLLRATPAGTVVGLLLSDVIGDDPAVIGSGPTVPSPTTASDALRVLHATGVWSACPQSVRHALRSGAAEPPLPPDPRVTNVVVGGNLDAVDGAAAAAADLGLRVLNLGCDPTADPETVARRLAVIVRGVRDESLPVPPPVCVVQGGEAPVRLPDGHGRGGRNQHLALLLLRELGGLSRCACVCAGTDGEDGPTDAAGGVIDESVAAAARALDLDDAIKRCDAYPFLDRCGGLLRTGRTGTNVADLRVVVVAA